MCVRGAEFSMRLSERTQQGGGLKPEGVRFPSLSALVSELAFLFCWLAALTRRNPSALLWNLSKPILACLEIPHETFFSNSPASA